MSNVPRPLRLFLLGVVPISMLLLAACGADLPATTLHPDGDHAQRIYDLLMPMLWTALVVFIVVEGALLYTVFRFRRKENSGIPAQIHGNTRVEIMWTIAPALIVLVLAVLTFRTQAQNAEMPPDALKVKATGHQWWYEFEYPDVGLVTANDLYLPVGKSVTVQLEAKDVIHSFWVPRLAGKTDMIPGNTNYLTFKPEREGIYHAECSVLCGESHANMGFRVVVVSQETFDNWIAQHLKPPAAPTGNALNGLAVFEKRCVACHVVKGVNDDPTAPAKIGPDLTYLGSRTTIAGGLLPNTTENLTSWLHNPEDIKPGNLMGGTVRPGYLTEQEIADLVAYLNGQTVQIDLPPPVGSN